MAGSDEKSGRNRLLVVFPEHPGLSGSKLTSYILRITCAPYLMLVQIGIFLHYLVEK